LAAYEGSPDLDALLTVFQLDFSGYTIDMNSKGLYRLRFVTHDGTLLIKQNEVFPAILTDRAVSVDSLHSNESEIVTCGVEALDNILAKIKPIDWESFQTIGRGGEVKPPSEKVYILRTVEQVLRTADAEGTPIVNHTGTIYYSTGTHYKPVNEIERTNFLIEAARQCGVPHDTAVYQTFAEKIVKQFLINSARHNSSTAEPDTPYINLRNGILFFDGEGHRFEGHSPLRFIRYCLHFDYEPKATAPMWQKHLDRSLIHSDKQMHLAKCSALPFYQGKIEKAPVLYGARDTGKSTTLDVIKALYGAENISAESLAALTKSDYHGDYARARLDGKLVNIASDIGKKIHDEGMTKMLISREMVSARNPNQRGFDMVNYARLIFAMNELPPQFFTDAALTKRVAIIGFNQQVRAEDKDTNFAEKIIASELPGVLNWIIGGLDELLKIGRLDPPPCCVEEMALLQTELDPLSAWLDEKVCYPGKNYRAAIKHAYLDFQEYCKENGNQVPSKKTFTKRLRDLGYEVYAPNNHIGVMLFYSETRPDNPSSTNNQSENGGQIEANPVSFPDGSPIIPQFEPTNQGAGHEGSDGSQNSGETFDCLESEGEHPAAAPNVVSSHKERTSRTPSTA
jgi:putative DNA primase/helicase